MGFMSQWKWLYIFLALTLTHSVRAQKILSTGVHTGFTIPLTADQGINADARYQVRYDIKWAPIGFNVALDMGNYGILINPGIVTIGQNFFVANSVGGQIGVRKIRLVYLQVPVGAKIRLIDLSFFRVSFTTAISAGYLLNGRDVISHQQSKMTFPVEVKPQLPPDYIEEYDGVAVPRRENLEIAGKNDYNTFQLFGSFGIRSDWDVTENTRVSLDLRSNISILDPRHDDYLQRIKNNLSIYEIYGKRRDIFVTLTLGVSKIIELEAKRSSQRSRRGRR